MSLEDLDRFLLRRKIDPLLAQILEQPLELDEFLKLAHQQGFQVTEADVFAAQLRDEKTYSAKELQHRLGDDARRLRHFIPG